MPSLLGSSDAATAEVKPEDIEHFTRLFNAHLAQASTSTGSSSLNEGEWSTYDSTSTTTRQPLVDPSAELDLFRAKTINAAHKSTYDRLADELRRNFHATKERQRNAQLYALLVQLPPFSLSEDDVLRIQRSSVKARQRRLANVRRVCRRFATPSNVGVRPFFGALRRLLEAQSNDRHGRPLQWLLDDAVLMEAGGEDFMRAAVWLLKVVLLCTEHKPSDAVARNPFRDRSTIVDGDDDNNDVLRVWTLSPFLTNPEFASLARAIPSHVLPRRGRGSKPAYADGALLRLAHDDEERQSVAPIALPTGSLRYAPVSMQRNTSYRGGWLEWLYDYLLSFVDRAR